jgi:inhibitor of cysteine peptidase
MMAIPIRILSILVPLLVAGCAAVDQRKITEADDNQTVSVAVGELVAVELPSNRSTGYGWEVDHRPASLEELGTPSYVVPPEAMPGSGGHEIFRFRAVAPGSDKLRLVYRRPWEHDAAPARVFVTSVDVR